MKKELKKVISGCIASMMLLATANISVMAAAVNIPVSYDMTSSKFPTGQVVNQCSDPEHTNFGFFADPEDASNDVFGIRGCTVTGKYADMRLVLNYSAAAIQFDFDIYRVDKAADLELKIIASNGGAGGNNVSLFKMDKSGNVVLNGATKATYDDNQWYNVRIKSNQAKTYHEVYMKKASETDYVLIGVIENADLGLSSVGYMNYFMKNDSTGYAYFDNMSWNELSGDVCKKIHYDFNTEISKTGSLYGLTINSNNMIWSTETFAGQTTLKAKTNETSAREIFNWEDIPDMEKIYVEANMGFDAGEDEKVNLPFQFGIRPVFAQADGTKGGAARNNMSEGIRFNFSRYITLENTVLSKPEGASLSNNVLYKAGYIYDRQNSKLKAYFIAANGKTFVQDASSNAYVQDKRYLAGIKLYQRANGDYMTGAGYYDYLYIDEAEEMRAESATPANYAGDIDLKPQLKVTYNYVIDPENMGTAVLKNSKGEAVAVDLSTSFGKTLVVTPKKNLDGAESYTLTVSGVKDLLGQTADEYSTSFTTKETFYIGDVTVNDNNKLVDGVNTVKCTLASQGSKDYDVIVIAALIDNATGELLTVDMDKAMISASTSHDVSLKLDSSSYSDYSMKVYIWDGTTIIPYVNAQEFTK